MHSLIRKVTLAVPLMAVSIMLTASGAFAQDARIARGGRTTVKLSEEFVSALTDLNVTPGTINPTELGSGRVYFPITSGVMDLDSAKIQLLHSGGLTLTAGATKVTLSSFIIDNTGSAPVITGLVAADNKLLGRVPLFYLVLPSGITLPLKPVDDEVTLKGVGVNLHGVAATALNSIFHVSAFKPGLNIGTANVYAFLQMKTW